jgi:hypothetical protein
VGLIVGALPSPDLGRKWFCLFGLRRDRDCKIFILNRLLLNPFISITYAGLDGESPGFAGAFFSRLALEHGLVGLRQVYFWGGGRRSRCGRYGSVSCTGVFRCAQDNGKNKQRQRQRQEQKQIPFGDDKQRGQPKTRATARTTTRANGKDNDKGNDKGKSNDKDKDKDKDYDGAGLVHPTHRVKQIRDGWGTREFGLDGWTEFGQDRWGSLGRMAWVLGIGIGGKGFPFHPCHTTGQAGPHPAVREVEAMRDEVSPACPPSVDPELHSEAFRCCATSDVYYAPPVAQFLWKLLVRSVPGKQSCHVSIV